METVSAQVASKISIRRRKGESPLLRTSRQKPEAYRASKARGNTRAASVLSITIKSLSCCHLAHDPRRDSVAPGGLG